MTDLTVYEGLRASEIGHSRSCGWLCKFMCHCLSRLIINICVEIALEETTLDAAKSSIVYGVTRSVSTPGRAVSQSVLEVLSCGLIFVS